MEKENLTPTLKALSPADRKNYEGFRRVRNEMKVVMEMEQCEKAGGKPISTQEAAFVASVERRLVELLLYFSEEPVLRADIGINEVDFKWLEKRGKVSPAMMERFYAYAEAQMRRIGGDDLL